jgi:hypothetical protein
LTARPLVMLASLFAGEKSMNQISAHSGIPAESVAQENALVSNGLLSIKRPIVAPIDPRQPTLIRTSHS